jgi:hypothetical protein
MAEKKHATSKPKPVHVVRSNEVVITLTARRSNSGYCYTDLTISREWVNPTTGRLAHGSSFFLNHTEDLVTAIQGAAAWLRGDRPAPAAKDTGPLEDYEHE